MGGRSSSTASSKSLSHVMTETSSTGAISIDWCHTVRCATEASWMALESPFPLGPCDQLVNPTTPNAVIFLYEQPTSLTNAHIIPIERLERALSLLLNHYPHLTGRLQFNAHDGSAEISCLGAGVHLVSATCSSRLDAFQNPEHGRVLTLPGAGVGLLAPFEATLDGVCREPMFTIQHTRFACGSVALGVLILHKLCDGEGFFQLMRDLAELYRGDGRYTTLSQSPHFRSYLSGFSEKNVTPEEKAAILAVRPPLLHIESTENDYTRTSVVSSSQPPPPNVGRFLRFSTRELATLKAAATDPAHTGNWVSTFEALCAHLYHHVHRARLRLREENEGVAKYGELSPTDILTTFNLRPHNRLGPEYIPPKYFPNAYTNLHTNIPSDVLADGPVHKIASIVHDLMRSPPGLSSRKDIVHRSQWIMLQPDKRMIKPVFRYGSGSLMISQWNKFDMYEGTAFDVPPTLVSPTFASRFLPDGLAIFLPFDDRSEEADLGAIDVALALSEPTWEALDQDEEFRRFRFV